MIQTSLRDQLAICASLVKFSHSIFALPFALAMAVYLTRDYAITVAQFFFLIAAVVSARTAAMAFNRLIDRHIDAQNPRTSNRELPAGKITSAKVAALLGASSLLFFFSAGMLGAHCFILAPVVLAILLGYSLTKRFTSCSHLVLGLALACAPGGVWYAITARFAWLPVLMMIGVLCWVAGFDILYSLQDQKFDSERGLYSVPARFGSGSALLASRVLHLFSILFLLCFGAVGELGVVYYCTVGLFAVALLSQHLTISPAHLDKIESAFFTRNAWASLVYFFGMIIERLT